MEDFDPVRLGMDRMQWLALNLDMPGTAPQPEHTDRVVPVTFCVAAMILRPATTQCRACGTILRPDDASTLRVEAYVDHTTIPDGAWLGTGYGYADRPLSAFGSQELHPAIRIPTQERAGLEAELARRATQKIEFLRRETERTWQCLYRARALDVFRRAFPPYLGLSPSQSDGRRDPPPAQILQHTHAFLHFRAPVGVPDYEERRMTLDLRMDDWLTLVPFIAAFASQLGIDRPVDDRGSLDVPSHAAPVAP